jgi:hypothetical protein
LKRNKYKARGTAGVWSWEKWRKLRGEAPDIFLNWVAKHCEEQKPHCWAMAVTDFYAPRLPD